MESIKQAAYRELVEKRKCCTYCGEKLTNPSHFPEFDTYEIGPWSIWQNSLDADVLLVGQDWGGVDYFTRHKGRDEDANPTNRNLMTLFGSINIPVSGPESGKRNPRLFFNNVILCMKEGGLTNPLEKKYAPACCSRFLKPLINLIEPRVVIALGTFAYEAIAESYGVVRVPFREAVERPAGFRLNPRSWMFPVFHCGAHGWNINRKGPLQIEDWKKIGKYLEETAIPGTCCQNQ